MKRQTITAALLAAVLLIFIFFKFISPKGPNSFHLTGEWQLDSSYAVNTIADSILQLPVGIFSDPKNKPLFKFNADSTFSGSKDSTTEKYYLRDSVLYVDEGKGYLPYPVRTMTDSLFSFMNKDSIVFVLKKK